MNERLTKIDFGLFIATLLMLGFGIVLVYSSSFALAENRYLIKHASRVLLGIIGFLVFINIDYHVWGRISKLAYLIAIVLLVSVLILPGSQEINGARRWVNLGFIQFQVSDFARMALILLIARAGQEEGQNIASWKVFTKYVIKIALVCGLIILEPNFSTSVIIATIAFAMLFISGARFLHIAMIGLSMIPIAVILVLSAPYRFRRWIGFMEMSKHASDLGYQARQSIIGLGHGGLFGVGLGKGEQKFFYLPEPHTDFIISILGEEIGFVGLLAIILLFGFIVFRGIRISLRAPDKMGQLMAFGFSFVIAIYALIHICVGTGLMPTTGVPLPFLSYGGVSLIFTTASIGILLNISSQTKRAIPLTGEFERRKGKLNVQ